MARTGGIRTKAKVLEAAVRLFGSDGYEATSLDDVADAVGVRKQTLLYYFPTKADLFAAAAAEAAQAVYEALDGALRDRDPGGLDRLPVFIDAVDVLAGARPEVFGMIREVARTGSPVADRVGAALRPLLDSAVAWFERGMDEGVLRQQDPRVAMLTIYSAVMGHLTDSSVQRLVFDGHSRARAADELVAFLRAALTPSGSGRGRGRPARGGR
jgi:TetR/AcrR family transcriptional regulator